MADGALHLNLDDDTSARLSAQAKAMGVPPEILAVDLLHQALVGNDAFATRRGDHISNHDLSEPGRPWSEVRLELLLRMRRKLADRT